MYCPFLATSRQRLATSRPFLPMHHLFFAMPCPFPAMHRRFVAMLCLFVAMHHPFLGMFHPFFAMPCLVLALLCPFLAMLCPCFAMLWHSVGHPHLLQATLPLVLTAPWQRRGRFVPFSERRDDLAVIPSELREGVACSERRGPRPLGLLHQKRNDLDPSPPRLTDHETFAFRSVSFGRNFPKVGGVWPERW
jgi:hypothetical protein